ncbi:class I SAM-dependent methyltransferase [Methanobrevibacter sp.]|uniref:class I SAM-dependent methyltransferase n=1 Tax=Methanobrevibacter sp. TaxID=66852 RepID=UPI0038709618
MWSEEERLDILEEELEELKNNVDLVKFMMMNQYLDSNKNFCPICGNISEFISFGKPERKNVRCTHCRSVERHRMVWLFFQKMFNKQLETKNMSVMHFAPEPAFYKYFSKFDNVDYYPVDLEPESYERRNIKIRKAVDMQDIPFPDDKFDIIYASHVLEHVPDDIKAMKELYRVLKYGGSCVLLVPLRFSLKKTIEKEEYNTPELRIKHYGQANHLRRYGIDFKDRLESVGFKVTAFDEGDVVATDIERKFYRTGRNRIFLCKKEL